MRRLVRSLVGGGAAHDESVSETADFWSTRLQAVDYSAKAAFDSNDWLPMSVGTQT